MGLWERIVMGIAGRPFRTVMLGAAIFILSVMAMAGDFFGDIVQTTYQEFVRLKGYGITVEHRTEGDIPSSMIEKIAALDHVIGYNAAGDYHYNYKPANFSNVPYRANSATGSVESEEIVLCGTLDTRMEAPFRNGEMTLNEGVYPGAGHKGVMIDSVLASENQLKLNDEIMLYQEAAKETISFKIIGIYETHKAPEIQRSNASGSYYTISPGSYIFCDCHSFLEMCGLDLKLTSLTFYVDGYDYIETVWNQMKGIMPEREYSVVNCSESSLSYYGTVILSLESTVTRFLNFTYITSLVIILLMTLLWMRDHYYEAGIYLALGAGKIKIVLFFIAEIIVIAAVSLSAAMLFANEVFDRYKEKLLKVIMGVSNIKISDDMILTNVLNNAVYVRPILVSGGMYFLVVIIVTLLAGIAVVLFHPKKLFEDS